ncbi:protein phosphatase [Roseomonas sp. JC162]|uniref:Protein phosphatase n=1 Tax=Neoroseomonas marina TaxID=1232220 RepID=A0A848EES1_9PROT|nr:protein phosphatase [Neoroseomonas marina]NMJ41865.1 protein phosphatase [Neoroseomonas marina]
MTLRGELRLRVNGQEVRITGGPFDAMPPGARGLCLEARAARAVEAEWRLDVPDFGVPDPSALRAVLQAMLAAMQARPQDAFHVGCRAGLGRTGMALACLAQMAGASEGDPVAWLRARYVAEAIETPEQEALVREFGAGGALPLRTTAPEAEGPLDADT